MSFTMILQAVGTLFPIIFPKQEFKPKRLGAVVVIFIMVMTSIHIVGLEDTEEGIELMEDVMQSTEK